jgi:hypothetical protein
LTSEVIQKLYEKGELTTPATQDPRALLQTAWFIVSLYFGKRGRENQARMNKSMLRLVKTASGEEYFEMNKLEAGTVLTSNNHPGGLEGSEDHSDGKIFSRAHSPRCSVALLKLISHTSIQKMMHSSNVQKKCQSSLILHLASCIALRNSATTV